jgi:hypothetical protein
MSNIEVVVAHYNEDLEWTKNIKYKCNIISKSGIVIETPPNKGNEASSYLQYIIQNYECLPDITIFVHGHRSDWHHIENMDEKINNLEFLYDDYYNINDGNVNRLIDEPESLNVMSYRMPDIEKILDLEIDINKIGYKQSAQFYVTKNSILSNDKTVYIKLYTYLMESKVSSYWTSRVFEFIWHFIFTKNIIDKI